MGGGRSTASAMYGIYRKQQIAEGMIERTMKAYGVPIDVGYVRVKVVNENRWAAVGGDDDAAGFYVGGTLYIRRKYFAGKRTTNVIIHEIIHGQGGTHRSKGLGSVLEEGTVEYITQGTLSLGVRGRSAEYALGYRAYENEVRAVSQLMQIVGRTTFLKYWRLGFGVQPGGYPHDAGHAKLARKISHKGFSRTAALIRYEYYGILLLM